MKSTLLILATLFMTACNTPPEQPEQKPIDKTGAFYINKNDTTYEIYSNKGQLILEYTPRNTDSASLKMLEDIYQTVKEFYNRDELREPKI